MAQNSEGMGILELPVIINWLHVTSRLLLKEICLDL